MIVGALTDWGLVKASSGLVTITDLAKNIIFALKPEEGEVAKIEAAKKISLFVEVSERYPQIATLEQFSLFLRDKSGADLSEVKTESSTIYKIYSSAANYLKSAESSKPPQETKEAAGVKMSMISETLPDGIIATISTKDGERLFIKDQAVLDEVYDAILRARQKSKTQGDK